MVVILVRAKTVRAASIIIVIGLLAVACSQGPQREVEVVDIDAGQAWRVTAARHRVQPGDTLYSLAWRYGLSVENLQKYNNLGVNSKLYVGQTLKLQALATRETRSATAVGTSKVGGSTGEVFASGNSADGHTATRGNLSGGDRQEDCCFVKRTFARLDAGDSGKSMSGRSWAWPLKGRVIKSYMTNQGLNKGIDIQSKLGEPVLAASDGKVVYAGSGLRDYGNLVILKHADKYLSAYGNNQVLLVKEGEHVRVGQKIAEVGESNQGVALHFEIRYDGRPVDPLRQLPPL